MYLTGMYPEEYYYEAGSAVFLDQSFLVIMLVIAVVILGLYLLCGSFALNVNQIYLLLCAFFFAVHILVVDHFAPKTDGVKLSCIQFFVAGLLDCILMLFVDVPTIAEVAECSFTNSAQPIATGARR